LQPRSKTLEEMARQAHFYFTDEIAMDEQAAAKFLTQAVLAPLRGAERTTGRPARLGRKGPGSGFSCR
jgi:hypothetical protein